MKFPVLILVTIFALAACNNTSERGSAGDKEEMTVIADPLSGEAKVHVVYFHGKQRCKTCITIQQLASETVSESFGDNPAVEFVEVDFSQKANEALAEKYEVAWSSLIIISGDRHTNLTDAAFANALKNPEVLKELITEKTQEYLNL